MRWLRSHIRLGSWSALFAVTIQLGLSFGHLHFDGVSSQSNVTPLALRWAATANPAHDAAAPAQRKPARVADDSCAICAIMRLASVPVAPPVLPLPNGGSIVSVDAGLGFALADAPPLFYRARAPPLA
jgi:hypothetical protein